MIVRVVLLCVLVGVSAIDHTLSMSCKCKKGRKRRACSEHCMVLRRQELRRLLNKSMSYGDLHSAIVWLNALIELERDSAIRNKMLDTLLELYVITGNNVAALAIADSILERNPADTHALSLAAISALNAGDVQKAFRYYTELAEAKGTLEPYWELLAYLWRAKAYDQLLVYADSILRNPQVSRDRVTLQISPTTTQRVPLSAAIFNLIGGVYHALGRYELAISYYQKALEISPEFILPRQNMEEISGTVKRSDQSSNGGKTR